MPDQDIRRVESKLDGLISASSEFRGETRQDLKDVKRRVSGMEEKFDAHMKEHQDWLKSKLAAGVQRWQYNVTTVVSLVGLAVAAYGLFHHP